ncbi:MFS transporter [Amycolatopsis azurea]|uniref:Integral membrane protein n=1 Tax=Amycolatopsis azurea DSM 43854 TaxID=1238180 RepID=M2Q2F7_9PSEU|nr:MFS transporter [Amycolatopsis azurea]EMD26155.1 integral membrane protein [Amycolatopsis azurea DSM 43854]OOC01404.1 MFS transporter [Amycolatopsis azurea DSM 43854]
MNQDTGHPKRWRILAVLVGSLMAVIIDTTILNVSLKTLADPVAGLGATHSELEWALSSYTLVFAALLFSWGVLADRAGRKRILLIGLALFGLASLASAYAQDPVQLIVARSVMGLGAAAVMPCTLAIIAAVFPLQERAKAIGVWTAAIGVALALGPVTGGLLLENFWWGSIFLINVPLVALTILAVVLVVPESRAPYRRKLDIVGMLLSIAGLVLIVYGVIEGGRLASFTAPLVWAPIAAGIVVLVLFVLHEKRIDQPAFDIGFFRKPAFTVAIAAVGFVSFAMAGFLFFSAFYLQSVRGYTPLQAGACMLALALAMMVFGPLSSKTAARFGPKIVCSAALLVVAAALGSLLLIEEQSPLAAILPVYFVLGTGIANVMPPAAVSIMMSIPREKAAVGSAMNNTMRQVGTALGVAILGAVLGAVYRSEIDGDLGALPAAQRAAAGESIEATLAVAQKAGGGAPGLVDSARESFVSAMHVSSLCAAIVALIGAAVVFRWFPGKQPAGNAWGGGNWGAGAAKPGQSWQPASKPDSETESAPVQTGNH